MNALDQLVELVPPPDRERRKVDWSPVERDMGVPLPSDYKRLVEIYGSGSFGDEYGGFLFVYQPIHENEYADLVSQKRRVLWAFRESADEADRRFNLDEGNEEIVPWGGTDNGDNCFWVVNGGDPDRWTVAVSERDLEWDQFEGSLTEFLVAVLSKERPCPIFPDDFVEGKPAFFPR